MALLFAVLNTQCAQYHESDLQDTATARKKIPDNVLRDLERGLSPDVVISLQDPSGAGDDVTGLSSGALLQDMELMPAALAEPLREEVVQARAAQYRALQDRVVDLAPERGLRLIKRYENLPLLHFQASELAALVALLQQPEVAGVYEDVRYEHQLTRSLPLIQQPAVAESGLQGQGTAIAVLDTGCDYTRPEFGSCANAGTAGCKVAYAADFGTNDGSRDDNGHGTNVSAIVLGVAPQTKILALDVFASSTARWTDILSAMDWVIANRTTYNIVGINMSLGGGQYSAPCGGDAMSNAIADARSLGIVSAIASGNNGWSQYMSAPGCAPDAISVGAVYSASFGGLSYSSCSDPSTAADKITCFSNSTSFLSVLAPGALITAGGHTMAGTSQATPHVAGAIALMRAAFPDESVASTVARLTESGPTITDSRNGVTKHRLDVLAALNGEGIADRTAPSGSIEIDAGDAFTRTRDVTLTLTGSDDQSAVEICVSDSVDCSDFVPFVGTLPWTLPSGDGTKRVYLTLQDAAHNQTQLSDTIVLDTTPPAGASLSIVPADGAVYLSWTQASDAGSGLASYTLVVAQDSPPSCSDGTPLYAGGATSFVHTHLQNGATYGYRLCPVDVVGNVAQGPTGLGQPAAERGTPFGAVVINGDAQYTNSQDVVLTLTATDTSDAAEICVSNADTCTSWTEFVPIVAWHLDATAGTATVKVWFKDGHGTLSATPVSDSIQLDLGKPSSSSLSADSGDAQVSLSWTAATDSASGLAGYRIVAALDVAPSCEEGVQVYRGTATSFVHSGLQNGVTYGYRVCPYDVAGNERDGGSVLARPAPERDAPVGSVAINAGAPYTHVAEVTLTLAASDASGVAEMCISNTPSCGDWIDFATSLPWTLDIQTSPAKVYAWFRDPYGNASPGPVSASIAIDTRSPTNGQLTATAQDGSVSLTWSGVTDASGIKSYKLVGQAGDAPSCSDGVALYNGSGNAFTHSGLDNGTVYGYRLCPTDGAGNTGAGPTASARPVPELDPPQGSIVINDDAAYTTSLSVNLRLAATDASGVAQMCLSNTTTCQNWVSYAATTSWTLSGSASQASVYAWFRDSYGSTSALPVSDTILIDTAPPSAGTLAATPDNAAIALSWTQATDAASGVAGYKLVGQPGDAPSCEGGPELYRGPDRTFTHSGLENGVLYGYRLCAFDAAGNMARGVTASATPAPEFDPPVGTVVINAGATYTNSAQVSLTLAASDASGVAQVCLSNTETCTSWLAYAATVSWSLDATSSRASVYAWFRDSFGNTTTAPVRDTITVDLVPPTSGALSTLASDASVQLSWSGAADAISGVAGYMLVAAAGSAPSCAKGAEIYRGNASSFTHTGLKNGTSYGYRLCAIDGAGNLSEGTTASARPAPEFDGPAGSVVINANAPFTRDRSVSLALSATDASPVTDMCISNSTSCSAWRTFAQTLSWSLGGADGTAKVYVWFRDAFGNVSAAPVSDTIVLDATAPTSGLLSGVPADGKNTLSWTQASDALSGVAGYKLVAALDAVPDCNTSTTLYAGSLLTYTHTGLENGRSYGYRICPMDAAGNVTSGASLVLRPAPEFDEPGGAVVINDDAAYTRDVAVSLTLSAMDQSGVTDMCISNTPTCQAWRPLQSSVDWTLAVRDGVARVYAWFKDSYGNVNPAAYSDSIIVDSSGPQAGALSASAGNAMVVLSWQEASDAGSGVARYDLYAALGSVPSCTGSPIYSGTDMSFTHTGLDNGSSYSYRLCPVDVAGNVGSGATATARPIPESVGPTCTVTINGGAPYTNSTSVSLDLSASDPSGAPEMCVSNSASCTTWSAASASVAWSLNARSGPATVSAWFKDGYGNVSAAPCTASIVLDQTPPSGGALTAVATAGQVKLDWTEGSDDLSGVARYKLVVAEGEEPSCATGSTIYEGAGLTFTHKGLSDGTLYSYRLCLLDGAGNLAQGASVSARPVPELDGPVGSVVINAGEAATRNRAVVLNIAASDPHGVPEMCIAKAASCSQWQSFASTTAWTLGDADGLASVNVWFKDDFGNVSATPASASILLDTQAPTGGQLNATPANASVTLEWTESVDSGSGVAGYSLRMSQGQAPSCESGTEIYSGTGRAYTHSGLSNGVVYGYRVCPVDLAGNVGAGASATAQPCPEFDGPEGTVIINGGEASTNSPEVALALSANDASGVEQMCVSNGATCTSWMGFAAHTPWTLDPKNGTASVRVWFKDVYGNVSASPASDGIVLDSVPPSGAVLSAKPGNTVVTLTWTAASDAISGVAGYLLRAAADSAPSCDSGQELYRGTARSFSHSGLQNGALYAYRVCPFDALGNVGAGTTASARPAPEFDPPTGRVYIQGGARIVNTQEVDLSLSATDQSTVTDMCLSNTTTCSDWVAFAVSSHWTLGPRSGAAVVRAWFRDEYGNAMQVPTSATTIVDMQGPSMGSLNTLATPGKVYLSWSAASDIAGVAGYTLVRQPGTTPPSSCAQGEVVYSGPELATSHELAAGTYSYRLCATDGVGNTSAGVTRSVTVP